jgi:hypothetical protein
LQSKLQVEADGSEGGQLPMAPFDGLATAHAIGEQTWLADQMPALQIELPPLLE